MAAWNSSQPRIEALRARWDRDPSSRLSLQLAEEYRRAGDLEQALHVLRTGIETTPSIAAEVALGRCLLEANDVAAAKVHLGRAIERDPTQMVAYRHLIDVHTRLGDRAAAESALDIYGQLNPTDPDLDQLAARLRDAAPPSLPFADELPPNQDQAPSAPLEAPESSSQLDEPPTAPPLDPVTPESPSVELMEASAEPARGESAVETATFQPLDESTSRAAGEVPATSVARSSTPFVSFLDQAEDETSEEEIVDPEPTPSASPPKERADVAPSRFGFAGEWTPSDVGPEETVPFFDQESSVFEAPQEGAIENAVVVDSDDLFSLEQVERSVFEFFALPSRPLRRPRSVRSEAGSPEGSSGPTRLATPDAAAPTGTLSRLYREQGHEEEADQLDRQARGQDGFPLPPPKELKVVDFAPLRQLQGASGVTRRKLVVAGYLARLTESDDVS